MFLQKGKRTRAGADKRTRDGAGMGISEGHHGYTAEGPPSR